jgi:hypothetical protein
MANQEKGIFAVHKDERDTATQTRDLGRIESIGDLLRQRGFFDTVGRDEVKHEKKDEAVLVH